MKGVVMKVSELMMMTYEEVKEIEQKLWKDWENASNVLKVKDAWRKEEV